MKRDRITGPPRRLPHEEHSVGQSLAGDLVCMTLNVGRVQPPAGASETLPPPAVPAN